MNGDVPVSKLLEAGQVAKVRLYQTLLNKIKGGEVLKASELKTLDRLEQELEGAGGADRAPEVFQSMGEAAAYARVSKRTIKYHADRGRIRVGKDGSIPRASVDAYLAGRSKAGRGGDRRKKEPDPVPGSVGSEKDQADLRYRLAKAEKEEYLVKQLKGHVVAKEEIYPVWAARVAVVTDGLNALIDRLPPLLEGKSRAEIQDILRDEIWSIRDSYAREGEYCPQG